MYHNASAHISQFSLDGIEYSSGNNAYSTRWEQDSGVSILSFMQVVLRSAGSELERV